MGFFNESLTPRYNRIIQRLHTMKGGPPAPQVGPEIIHDITLESDRIETLALGYTGIWSLLVVSAAVAGQSSEIWVYNPAGSGIILVIEGLAAYCATGRILAGTFSTTPVQTAATPNKRDTRLPDNSSGMITGSGSSPLSGITGNLVDIPPGSAVHPEYAPFFPPFGIAVIGPGTGFMVEDQTVNEALNGTIFFRVRTAEPGELTPLK